jgi:hypothetical protein
LQSENRGLSFLRSRAVNQLVIFLRNPRSKYNYLFPHHW